MVGVKVLEYAQKKFNHIGKKNTIEGIKAAIACEARFANRINDLKKDGSEIDNGIRENDSVKVTVADIDNHFNRELHQNDRKDEEKEL